MRRGTLLVLTLSVALSVGGGQIAGATSISPFPLLSFMLEGRVSPQELPRQVFAPASLEFHSRLSTSDGSHPPALREMVVDIDKDVKLNVKGYPVCEGGGRESRDPQAVLKVCRDAIVGGGRADIEVAFPEQKPILIPSPLTVFNGGEKGGKITLYIHVFITVPAPAAIVTTVTISRKGSSGIHSVSKIPVAAGGSGSALDFNFKLGKTYSYKGKKVGYFEAKCPDGNFKVNAPKAVFKNEAKIPGVAPETVLKGSLVVPCTPKG